MSNPTEKVIEQINTIIESGSTERLYGAYNAYMIHIEEYDNRIYHTDDLAFHTDNVEDIEAAMDLNMRYFKDDEDGGIMLISEVGFIKEIKNHINGIASYIASGESGWQF